jgi:hypothetical protein
MEALQRSLYEKGKRHVKLLVTLLYGPNVG